ncbi:hypothetical protein GGR57DRAFT_449879 [Xylariaceae sp. FL1272]|nr:hypothetical protein GGR57DRAFT_449879 [Xylariaceae sp. FL1272]
MAHTTCSINSLPNEILINALESFNTRSLLPVAAVSRRFRGVVGRLHYYRLVQATILREHEMILECYHPVDKLSAPYLFCRYLDTYGLSKAGEEADLEDMNHLYTRFEPFLGEENRCSSIRRPTAFVSDGIDETFVEESPSQKVQLEAGEPFTQLCVLTNLIKVGPGRGLFLSDTNVTDGVIRVWRSWLQDQAARSAMEAEQRHKSRKPILSIDDPSILWADSSKNVGLKFRVKADDATSMLTDAEDDPAVSYTLEYEELIVRTNRLMLSIETSEIEQVAHAETVFLLGSSVSTPNIETQYPWTASPTAVPAH